MQTYYKEFQIQDNSTENIKLQDKEKMELAEYRATKHFSDTLINKIAKDEDIKKYNKYEHDLEILRHVISSDDFKESVKQASDEFEKFRKSGKGGFNDFIEYLEKEKKSGEAT